MREEARLDPEQAAELEAVAEVEGVPVAEAIRNAIAEHIEARRRDEAFQARLSSEKNPARPPLAARGESQPGSHALGVLPRMR